MKIVFKIIINRLLLITLCSFVFTIKNLAQNVLIFDSLEVVSKNNKSIYFKKLKPATGIAYRFDINGNVILKIDVKHGFLTGNIQEFYSDGSLKTKCKIKKGIKSNCINFSNNLVETESLDCRNSILKDTLSFSIKKETLVDTQYHYEIEITNHSKKWAIFINPEFLIKKLGFDSLGEYSLYYYNYPTAPTIKLKALPPEEKLIIPIISSTNRIRIELPYYPSAVFLYPYHEYIDEEGYHSFSMKTFIKCSKMITYKNK